MSTTTQKQNTSSSLPTNNKPVESAKAPEPATTASHTESPKTEGHKEASVENPTTIISITVNEKLARQARFLARARGCSISSLFTDAASLAIPVALKAALADLQGDLE